MGGDRPEMITQHAFQIWDRGARLSGSHDRHCQQAGRDRPRGRSGLTGGRLAANGRDGIWPTMRPSAGSDRRVGCDCDAIKLPPTRIRAKDRG
jgi:hypothetical protein